MLRYISRSCKPFLKVWVVGWLFLGYRKGKELVKIINKLLKPYNIALVAFCLLLSYATLLFTCESLHKINVFSVTVGQIMKKKILIALMSSSILVSNAFAADLMQVYQDALVNDPTFLAAKTTYLSALQDVPISKSFLFPQISIGQGSGGSAYLSKIDKDEGDDTSRRGYGFKLNLSQQIFNYSYFAALKEAKASVKEAAATYYSAAQTLMVDVATDYFTILLDQAVLRYNESNVKANKSSLDQAQEQYKVGLKTLTDVYTSQAAYSTAVSEKIDAETTLTNDIENLRALTGKTYDSFEPLNENFPLVSPDPEDIDQWVKVAVNSNWDLKARHYESMAAMAAVKQQWGGHMPTLELDASYGDTYYDESDGNGSTSEKTGSVGVDLEIPIFQGGLVSSQTKQAEYDYQTAVHNMEVQYRTVVTSTRQNYLNVVSGISAIKADQTSIKSNESSLKGLQAGYNVGTQTMVDVLNQQSLLFSAQQDYATDQFEYITSLINLKSYAGTLSVDDIKALNGWLGDGDIEAQDNSPSIQTLDLDNLSDEPKDADPLGSAP